MAHLPDDIEADDPALEAIADAILNGGVDFAGRPGGGSPRPNETQFEALAKIAALHRQLGLGDTAAAGEATEKGEPAAWGHLRLLDRIGAGAFGEVFRAWDSHLDREVALKLLGPLRPGARDDRGWVIEEARHLASIRHPNVVTVYGADRQQGTVGFWTELIHGQTLAALVGERGPIDPDEAIGIAIDVCRAVAAVHAAGLLHRDIKANNVMREEGGRIVLLDFGATKNVLLDSAPGDRIGDPHGPTGTPLYVAPELWRQRPATPQSDLYSIGVLLYFLLSGRYPIEGETVADVGEAHRAGAPVSLRDRRPGLRADIIDIVDRALAGDPRQRFATVGDLERALSAARAGRWALLRPLASWRVALPFAAVVAVAGAGIIATIPDRPREPLTIVSPVGEAARANAFLTPSYDGRFYPYWTGDGRLGIWSVDDGSSQTIATPGPADRGARSAFLSPQGERIAYVWEFADETYELRVANRDGSHARVILERRGAYLPLVSDWSRDGKHLLCWLQYKGGGAALVIVSLADMSTQIVHQQSDQPFRAALSPDGQFIAFHRGVGGPGDGSVVIISRHGGTPREVARQGRRPFWTPDGAAIMFQRISPERRGRPGATPSDLWRVPVRRGSATGEPEKVLPNVGSGVTMYQTDDWRLFTMVGKTINEVFLTPVDLTGASPHSLPTRLETNSINGHASPSWSPKGDAIAYFAMRPSGIPNTQPVGNLMIYDVATARSRDVRSTLAFQGTYRPRWLGDDAVVVYGGDIDHPNRIGFYRVDLWTGQATPALVSTRIRTPPSWDVFDDGRRLIYSDEQGIATYDVATGTSVLIVPRQSWKSIGPFGLSRDGRTLAFNAVDFDDQHVLVLQPVGGAPRVRLRSPARIGFQSWSPDGTAVLYATGLGRACPIWIVPVTEGEPHDTGLVIPYQSNPLTLNPQGTRAAYPERIDAWELWIRPLPAR